MDGQCPLAALDEARAFATGTSLIISAQGTVPESCWGVEINRNMLPVDPPQFVLERCRTGSVCLEVVTPYSASAEFEMSPVPDEIVLYYEDGKKTGSKKITVEPIPTADVDGLGPDQATGTSYAFSFEDALDQALTALQGEPSNQPVDATVTTIEAGRGGIVPPYIRVTVTRS